MTFYSVYDWYGPDRDEDVDGCPLDGPVSVCPLCGVCTDDDDLCLECAGVFEARGL